MNTTHPSKLSERLTSELRAEIKRAKQDGDTATLQYLIDEGGTWRGWRAKPRMKGDPNHEPDK